MQSPNIKSDITFIDKWNENMKKIEEKTGIDRQQYLIAMGICFTCILIGLFDKYMSIMITIYHPILWSLKAIDKNSKKSKDKDEAKQWITYWVIFGFFNIFDMISPLIMMFIPFYFFIRTVVLLWLYLPNTRGAITVYNLVAVEFFKLSRKYKIDILKNDRKDSLLAEVEDLIQKREQETIKFEDEICSNENMIEKINLTDKKNN